MGSQWRASPAQGGRESNGCPRLWTTNRWLPDCFAVVEARHVMQHLRTAVATVSIATGFVAGLFAHHDAVPIHSEPIPVVPTSCQQALTQGAHLVSLSVAGASQLLDVLDAKPSQSAQLLDRYGHTLAATNKRLPAYAASWRECERRLSA